MERWMFWEWGFPFARAKENIKDLKNKTYIVRVSALSWAANVQKGYSETLYYGIGMYASYDTKDSVGF